MNTVLVFGGRAALNNENLRWQLLRVPEVSMVIKEAQEIIDTHPEVEFDLASFLQSENSKYHATTLWKDLASQLVQVGLYNRFQKNRMCPRFVVGSASPISALKICFEGGSMTETLNEFFALMENREKEAEQDLFLIGHKLENMKSYEIQHEQLKIIKENLSSDDLVLDIARDHIVDQVISVGDIITHKNMEIAELSFMSSVSMDPMLSWLLPHLQTA